MFGDIWKRFRWAKKEPRPVRDVRLLAAPLLRKAVRLKTNRARSRSYLGSNKRSATDRLSLLARIDLAELQQTMQMDWLPRDGALLFFFDVQNPIWDKPCEPSSFEVQWTSQEPDIDGVVSQISVGFEVRELLPYYDRDAVDELELDDAEHELYADLYEELTGNGPCHQIGGWPQPMQDDHMEDMLSGPDDSWQLLLQLDSDERFDNWKWGDSGKIYFWVRESDARKRDFSKVGCILQCA